MIVWGGEGDETGRSQFADGAAFNPGDGSWEVISPSPLSPRRYHVAVWTGDEMLVVGGVGLQDGAAYNPSMDMWRQIAESPVRIGPRSGESIAGITGSVWTGDELVVWHTPTNEAAAYSPSDDSWRLLAPPAFEADRGVLRWSGDVVYAVGADTGKYPGQVPLRIARLRHSENEWETLPEVGLWTAQVNIGAQPELTAWVGNVLVAWTDSGVDGRAVAFDPDPNTWRDIAPTSVHGCKAAPEPLVLDQSVLVFGWCGDDAIYNTIDDTWTPVNVGDGGQARYSVWTGSEVLNWGDTCCYGTGGAPFTVAAWRYTPQSK